MTNMLVLIGVGAASVLAFVSWRKSRYLARERFVRHYQFPKGLFDKLQKKRPGLELKDCQLVGNALRQFFLAHLMSGRKFVSMPSQVTDDLWHELILYTRNYDEFCRKGFGRFMHHTPAVVLSTSHLDNAGLRRAWWYACKEENINPKRPSRLPLLFAIDAKLGIADGFRYAPQCEALRQGGNGEVYCGGDFGSYAFDGGLDGFGTASDSSFGDFFSGDFFGGDGGSADIGGGDGCGGGGCGGGGCGGGGD